MEYLKKGVLIALLMLVGATSVTRAEITSRDVAIGTGGAVIGALGLAAYTNWDDVKSGATLVWNGGINLFSNIINTVIANPVETALLGYTAWNVKQNPIWKTGALLGGVAYLACQKAQLKNQTKTDQNQKEN